MKTRPEVRNRLIVTAYLGHLGVPLFLLIDILTAGGNYSSFPASDRLVFLASGLWLASGIGVLILVYLVRRGFTAKWIGPLISLYAVYLSLLLVELFLQVGLNTSSGPGLWPPGRNFLLRPDPAAMSGVSGAPKFTTNEFGLRSTSSLQTHDAFKVVAVGGSTTENTYLDDTETWTNLLMAGLNARQSNSPIWVGNAGQSGRNTVDHLALMQSLTIITDADMLIFQIGINDLQTALAFEGGPTQDILQNGAEQFRRQVLSGGRRERSARPFYKKLGLYGVGRNVAIQAMARFVPLSLLERANVGPAAWLNDKRRARADAPPVSLPGLYTSLNEYRQRVRAIARECWTRSVRCLFLTQPSMWRDDLTAAEQELLWFGWVGPFTQPMGYVSATELAEAMVAYNQALLGVCQQDHLECYDLASSVPKDTSAFYDDVHFNESGARIVAQLLADYVYPTLLFMGDDLRPDGSNYKTR